MVRSVFRLSTTSDQKTSILFNPPAHPSMKTLSSSSLWFLPWGAPLLKKSMWLFHIMAMLDRTGKQPPESLSQLQMLRGFWRQWELIVWCLWMCIQGKFKDFSALEYQSIISKQTLSLWITLLSKTSFLSKILLLYHLMQAESLEQRTSKDYCNQWEFMNLHWLWSSSKELKQGKLEVCIW